jgi:hypothetical protein
VSFAERAALVRGPSGSGQSSALAEQRSGASPAIPSRKEPGTEQQREAREGRASRRLGGVKRRARRQARRSPRPASAPMNHERAFRIARESMTALPLVESALGLDRTEDARSLAVGTARRLHHPRFGGLPDRRVRAEARSRSPASRPRLRVIGSRFRATDAEGTRDRPVSARHVGSHRATAILALLQALNARPLDDAPV